MFISENNQNCTPKHRYASLKYPYIFNIFSQLPEIFTSFLLYEKMAVLPFYHTSRQNTKKSWLYTCIVLFHSPTFLQLSNITISHLHQRISSLMEPSFCFLYIFVLPILIITESVSTVLSTLFVLSQQPNVTHQFVSSP